MFNPATKLIIFCGVLCGNGVICRADHKNWGLKLNSGYSKKEKQFMLDMHNMVRARVAKGQDGEPQAANMIALEWDDRLENQAQRWTDGCHQGHNTNDQRKFKPYGIVGQNYQLNGGIKIAVMGWYNEYKQYTYSTRRCSGICGHYTQIAWAKTRLVGCGHRSGCARTYPTEVFCDYAWGGNYPMDYIGAPHPYITGRACSKCPPGYSFCMDGLLCECVLSSCKNGKLNRAECKCECDAEWDGVQCDKPCKDTKTNYCPYNMGLCAWNSLGIAGQQEVCRKSCGFCPGFDLDDPGLRNRERLETRVNLELDRECSFKAY
ncbi:scoloptoxin SSD552-like [Tubulanus polymorphus]|uniref:scoloptoxin SSD552-like n=1 Tax=Tubulanus polymorphus TaxID=672921 RepID=UPI003DA53050